MGCRIVGQQVHKRATNNIKLIIRPASVESIHWDSVVEVNIPSIYLIIHQPRMVWVNGLVV
jgi:hypothetical protein